MSKSVAATQPLLFHCQDRLWIKADKSVIEVRDAACFSDAVELLLAVFYVFNVQYPYQVKPMYELFETLLHIRKAPTAVVAKELLRQFQL